MKRELLSPLAVVLGTIVVLGACSSDPDVGAPPSDPASSQPTATPTTVSTTIDPPGRPQGFAPGQLAFFGDCPALLGYMQTEATERLTAWGLGGGGAFPMNESVL